MKRNVWGQPPRPALSGVEGSGRAKLGSAFGPLKAAVILCLLGTALAYARTDLTVDELKARISSASVPDKAKICLQIAEKQLDAMDKLYAADEMSKAQQSLTDVIAYTELARDYSIQSHKHEKQIEIAVRAMSHKLHDVLHVLAREEQGPVNEAISRLERVRDDLLMSMFPKGAK